MLEPRIFACRGTSVSLCVPQVKLDGYALPIKKLNGTEPVESLDLSGKFLGRVSAIVIASLIRDNASITQVCLIRES